jgi:hypothetical protein
MSEPSWEQKIVQATEGIPLGPAVLFVVGLLTFLLYRSMNRLASKDDDWAKELNGTKVNRTSQSEPTGPLKNIWEERQKNGSAALERTQKTDDDGKPFGSSYYYAHNSLRRTGGYKDGLRMEDYQMETPRLLSKGGVDIRDQAPGTTTEDSSKPTSKSMEAVISSEKQVVAPPCIPIKKYLWDDPGDHKAIGTIRIDQLADNLSWKEADISDIQIDLKNESSLNVIVTAGEKVYQLYIQQFYGKVEEVKKVAKRQRLLVRLYKRKKDTVTGETDEKNIKAWPTPYKKAL